MAHKRKSLEEPKRGGTLRPDQRQQKIEYSYKIIQKMEEQLKHEHTTELTHQSKINQEKNMMGKIHKLMTGINETRKNPLLPQYIFRKFNGNYVLPLTLDQAHDTMMAEQKEFRDRIGVQEIQMRKAIEKQNELRGLIRRQYVDLEKALLQ